MGIFKNLKAKIKPADSGMPTTAPVYTVIGNDIADIVPEVMPVVKPEPTPAEPEPTKATEISEAERKLAEAQQAVEEERKAKEAPAPEEPATEEQQEITIQQVLENFDHRLKRLEYHNRLLL